MFKKLSTKTLLILLVVLGAIVAIVLVTESRRGERTFKSQLAEFDQEEVTSLKIITKGDINDELILLKNDDGWLAEKGMLSYNADEAKVERLLNEILKLKPERVAATIKDKWEAFEVTDSTSVKVIVYKDSKVLSDIHIGKFSYTQPKQQAPTPNRYGQGPPGKMTTYVRVEDDDITYAVDGFLRMTFSSDINGYRNTSIIKSTATDWTKLTFTYPADSSFTLSKQNDKWLLNGLLTDSARVASYLRDLENLSNSNFVEEDEILNKEVVHSLRIEGNNMAAPIELTTMAADSTNEYAISSSLNKGTYFSGGKAGLFTKIFKGENSFYSY